MQRSAMLIRYCALATALVAPPARRGPHVLRRAAPEPQRFPFASPFPFGRPANETSAPPPPSTPFFGSPRPKDEWRRPFDDVRRFGDLPKDATQLLPALQRFLERAEGDNYELIQQVSRQAERALTATENPLKLVQDVLGGALAERLPATVDPSARALTEKLLRDVDAYPEAAFPPGLVQTVDLVAERPFLERATLCASLSSAVYANEDARSALRGLDRAHVASGCTHDVAWSVVDGVRDGRLERHVIIRGFDASDDTGPRRGVLLRGDGVGAMPRRVDAVEAKETRATHAGDNVLLVKRVLCARPVPIPLDRAAFPRDWDAVEAFASDEAVPGLVAHAGFLFLAEALLDDLRPHLDVAPSHSLIFTGHSIGGALAGLCTVLCRIDDRLTTDPSAVVFAPLPCLRAEEGTVLATLNLDETTVRSFVQPWDPLVRWFTAHDPCYPLVADTVEGDIYTLFASGPPRVLRNVARAILETAEDWPEVRAVYLQEANQTFDHLGEAHLLMPAQAARYLADRLFALVVDVPETVLLVRCAAADLPEALDHAFQLEEFSISLAPAGLRSFIHHFHPAYSAPLEELVAPSGD